EDEIHKLRGHMRFLIWASKPEHKVYLDNFDCQSCLKKGLAKGRNCSKFTSEEIDRYYKDLNGKEPEIAEEEVSAPRKRVGRYKSKKVFSSKSEAEDKQGTKYLKDDGSGRVKLV